MTEHHPAPHDGGQASAAIEITREMKDAGAEVMTSLYGVVSLDFLVERVYSAMERAKVSAIPDRKGRTVQFGQSLKDASE